MLYRSPGPDLERHLAYFLTTIIVYCAHIVSTSTTIVMPHASNHPYVFIKSCTVCSCTSLILSNIHTFLAARPGLTSEFANGRRTGSIIWAWSSRSSTSMTEADSSSHVKGAGVTISESIDRNSTHFSKWCSFMFAAYDSKVWFRISPLRSNTVSMKFDPSSVL